MNNSCTMLNAVRPAPRHLPLQSTKRCPLAHTSMYSIPGRLTRSPFPALATTPPLITYTLLVYSTKYVLFNIYTKQCAKNVWWKQPYNTCTQPVLPVHHLYVPRVKNAFANLFKVVSGSIFVMVCRHVTYMHIQTAWNCLWKWHKFREIRNEK